MRVASFVAGMAGLGARDVDRAREAADRLEAAPRTGR